MGFDKKANQSGKVFDKMDKLCTYLLAYEPNCPNKYRQSLWLPLRHYMDMAQAEAEMAYLEPDAREKFRLISDARKHFRIFKRYHARCEMTGEFRFGQVKDLDMLEYIEDIDGALGRWFTSQKKLLLVSNDAAAASTEHRILLEKVTEGSFTRS